MIQHPWLDARWPGCFKLSPAWLPAKHTVCIPWPVNHNNPPFPKSLLSRCIFRAIGNVMKTPTKLSWYFAKLYHPHWIPTKSTRQNPTLDQSVLHHNLLSCRGLLEGKPRSPVSQQVASMLPAPFFSHAHALLFTAQRLTHLHCHPQGKTMSSGEKHLNSHLQTPRLRCVCVVFSLSC